MPSELLLHSRLEAELRALRNRDKRWRGAVDTAIRKLLSDPYTAGSRLQGLADRELQGRVRRLYVGGDGGYRLFYWLPTLKARPELKLAIPIYLSESPRSGFDYDSSDLDEVGMNVVRDYRAGKLACFRRFQHSAVLSHYLDQPQPK